MTPRYTRLEAAQRRDQILDAANALFAERGYDEVSIEDIASAAGVTRGLVHHYFGGRKEVYLALVDRLGNVREERLRPPRGRSSRARVADSVSRWLDWTEANRTIWLATVFGPPRCGVSTAAEARRSWMRAALSQGARRWVSPRSASSRFPHA